MALEMQEISLEYSAKLEKEKIELKKEKMGRKISKKIGRKMDRNEPEDRCWDTIDHKKKCMVSRFGRWTKCSTTCGLGVTFRFRDFTHLEPDCTSTFSLIILFYPTKQAQQAWAQHFVLKVGLHIYLFL